MAPSVARARASPWPSRSPPRLSPFSYASTAGPLSVLAMSSTNYTETFIQVAEDCPAQSAQVPPAGPASRPPTIALLQYRLLSERPYELTSDDLLFEVHAIRQNIEPPERTAQREAFFAKPQACLRSSPLAKRYGWGFHHDGQGRVALVPLGSTRYQELSEDSSLTQLRAMRSRRAS